MKTRLMSGVVPLGQRGTVVIPAEIRKDMGLECGASIMVLWNGEELRLQPVPSDPIDQLAWALNRAYEGMSAEEVESSLKELHEEWER